jgi:hypothetical protein
MLCAPPNESQLGRVRVTLVQPDGSSLDEPVPAIWMKSENGESATLVSGVESDCPQGNYLLVSGGFHYVRAVPKNVTVKVSREPCDIVVRLLESLAPVKISVRDDCGMKLDGIGYRVSYPEDGSKGSMRGLLGPEGSVVFLPLGNVLVEATVVGGGKGRLATTVSAETKELTVIVNPREQLR